MITLSFITLNFNRIPPRMLRGQKGKVIKITKEELIDWISNQNCVEFDGDEATYFIGTDEDGELTHFADADSQYTFSVDCSEWAEDDSPDRFYSEFENLDNPEFRDLVSKMLKEINEEG